MTPFTLVPPVYASATPKLARSPDLRRLAGELRRWFDVDFSFWDGVSGELLWADPRQPHGDELLRAELARTVAGQSVPCVVDDQDSVLLLALPLAGAFEQPLVALGAIAIRRVFPREDLSGPAGLLDLDEDAAARWINSQTHWPVEALLRLAAGFLEKSAAECRADRLQEEVDQVSGNLGTTYEEISLLHSLTQSLRISNSDEQLGRLVLEGLFECLPVEGAALLYLPVEQAGQSTYKARTQSVLLTAGECPLDCGELGRLIESLQLEAGCSPYVANQSVTSDADWPFPQVRQVIITPLFEGPNLLGWMAAFNHRRDLEFGTVEASLLRSVAALLGIHSGNHELYRQQAEFLANVVRALTSAIDAKDPYTCGHSDRVARVSVRLAQALGCDRKMLNTLYMAGLLHDIGKIGIDDKVLRKPGRLTPQEYEHIKQHPELGYRILADLKPLADALPVVLHHHEQWNGKGYPHGLAGEAIPYSARIVAVADAYDAMSSDRPYRKGMPGLNVDQIFRAGAGQQWDPQVVEAYFAVREEIRAISGHERANLTLDVQQWV